MRGNKWNRFKAAARLLLSEWFYLETSVGGSVRQTTSLYDDETSAEGIVFYHLRELADSGLHICLKMYDRNGETVSTMEFNGTAGNTYHKPR